MSRPVYVYGNISPSYSQNEKCFNQSCRGNQNTHFVSNKFFFSKIVPFFNIIFEKYFRAGQDTDDNMAHALAWWVTRAADTYSEYVVLIASPQQQWPDERATLPVLFQ